MDQFSIIPETKAAIIVRIADKRAALGTHFPQQKQAFLDKGFANADLLVFGQDGNRTEAVPVLGAIRNAYRRKRDVADNLSIDFHHERKGQRAGRPQGLYNMLFRVMADGKRLEGRDRDVGDRLDIGGGLFSDDHMKTRLRLA